MYPSIFFNDFGFWMGLDLRKYKLRTFGFLQNFDKKRGDFARKTNTKYDEKPGKYLELKEKETIFFSEIMKQNSCSEFYTV